MLIKKPFLISDVFSLLFQHFGQLLISTLLPTAKSFSDIGLEQQAFGYREANLEDNVTTRQFSRITKTVYALGPMSFPANGPFLRITVPSMKFPHME